MTFTIQTVSYTHLLAAVQQVGSAHQTGGAHGHSAVFIRSGNRQKGHVGAQDVVHPVVCLAQVGAGVLHVFELLGGTFGSAKEERVGVDRLAVRVQKTVGQEAAGAAYGHVLQLWLPFGQQVVNAVGGGDVDAIIDPVAALHQLDGLLWGGQFFLVLPQDIRFHGGNFHGMYRSFSSVKRTPSDGLEGVLCFWSKNLDFFHLDEVSVARRAVGDAGSDDDPISRLHQAGFLGRLPCMIEQDIHRGERCV